MCEYVGFLELNGLNDGVVKTGGAMSIKTTLTNHFNVQTIVMDLRYKTEIDKKPVKDFRSQLKILMMINLSMIHPENNFKVHKYYRIIFCSVKPLSMTTNKFQMITCAFH